MIEFILHFDVHLQEALTALGPWTYAILFAIIFCETGLVVTPFLPGDSLLFAIGALAATNSDTLHIGILAASLSSAAIGGDALNYAIGRRLGPSVFRKDKGFLLNKKHLETTRDFYERHGGKTIIIARFLPILRTFAPFVAGIGKMNYGRFALFNVSGGLLWILSFLLAGYFFGNIPVVKANFRWLILGIIIASVLPMAIRMGRSYVSASFPKRAPR